MSADKDKIPASRSAPATAADVVDSLGLGLAQARVAVLALGVWFTDGLDICLVTVTTPTMAREFDLTHAQRGLLTTAAMFGVAIGCFGFVGDLWGRKPPILFSYLFTVVMNVVTVGATSFGALFLTRLGVGIAMGVGMSPSIAMMSETTPKRWRMAMAGAKGVIGISGFLFGNVSMYLSDPTLVHLRWRALFLYCSIPGVFLGLAACLFLPESPAFLAQRGDREAAGRVLDSMRRLNCRPDVPFELAGSREDVEDREGQTNEEAGALSMRSQLNVIFGKSLIGCTTAALVLNLAINVIHYHQNYGEPQVFTSDSASLKLEPAAQLMIANSFGLIGFPITIVASMCLSRRSGIVLAFAMVSALTLAFASTVTAVTRKWYTESLFQFSMCVLRGVFSMTWNFVHQFSVEIYPVACSTTGGAAVIGVGRIGSCLAPLIFEFVSASSGVVVASYYMMGCVALAVALLTMLLVPSDMAGVFRRAEAEVQAMVLLEGKLSTLGKSAKDLVAATKRQ
jgi:MFS family permease